MIGSSCVAAYWTRDLLKEQYSNPFCWCSVPAQSIIYLIEHYKSINYDNVRILPIENNPHRYKLIIDGNVEVRYTHYVEDPSVNGLKTYCNDVISSNIKQYILDKYRERVKRMLASKDEPIFILCSVRDWINAPEALQILNSKTPYKILVVETAFAKKMVDGGCGNAKPFDSYVFHHMKNKWFAHLQI